MSAVPMTPAPVGTFSAEQMSQLGIVLGRMVSRGQQTHAYYRKPDGFIGIGPSDWRMEAQLERRRRTARWHRLRDTEGPDGNPLPAFDLYEYTLHRPFENLALLGRLDLIPRAQVIELGLQFMDIMIPSCGMALSPFHFKHEESCFIGARRYEFPQLFPGDYAPVSACQYCGQEAPSKQALANHVQVMHKDEWQHEALGTAIVRATRETSQVDVVYNDVVDAPSGPISRPVPSANFGAAFVCGACGSGYDLISELVACSERCNGSPSASFEIEERKDATPEATSAAEARRRRMAGEDSSNAS